MKVVQVREREWIKDNQGNCGIKWGWSNDDDIQV